MRLFLHLLLNACYSKRYIYGIPLERGQFYSSTRALSEQLSISTKYITASIKKLRDSGEIMTERFGKGTIFTIVHYDNYQGNDNKKNVKEHPKGNGIGSIDF